MTRTQLIKEATRLYKNSLNPTSKWFRDDLRDFECRIGSEPTDRLKSIIGRLKCLNGEDFTFNAEIENEKKKLEMGGMYDIGNMKPENGLD